MKLWKAGSERGFVEQNGKIHVCTLSQASIGINGFMQGAGGFTSGSVVKNLPAMQELKEMHVWSLGQEDPLEEGMATHSSILTWSILWKEEPGGVQSIGSQRVGHDWSNLACTHRHRIWHEKYSSVEKFVLWTLMHSFCALKKLRKHTTYTDGWICKDA